jgi:hypothetical protein
MDYDQFRYEQDQKDAGVKAAQDLSAFVNRHSKLAFEAFASQLTQCEHRTLQQLAFGLFWLCIKSWAKREHFDARNEYTVKTCKDLVESREELYLPYV